MPDLGSVLERADRAVARVPLPPDGLERLRLVRDRRRRNQRIAAGVVGIAVFVAAVWIVTSGGAFDRSVTPATTGPTVAPDYPGRIGLVGLAPEGAIPSSPSRGELVVGFGFGHTGGDPGRFSLDVYADGRLIWDKLGEGYAGGDPTATGLIEQHLTPEGVELIRSEVLATGLFAQDAHLTGGYVPFSGAIEVLDDDRLVRVTWGGTGPERLPDVLSTPEQADALQRLDERLEDLASWLPASAWDDSEMRPFVPSRYSFCLGTGRDVGLDSVLASLPRQAEDLLREWDIAYREGSYSEGYDWCSAVTTERARALAEVLDGAGVRSNGGDVFGLVYISGSRNGSGLEVTISFEPMLPHDP